MDLLGLLGRIVRLSVCRIKYVKATATKIPEESREEFAPTAPQVN